MNISFAGDITSKIALCHKMTTFCGILKVARCLRTNHSVQREMLPNLMKNKRSTLECIAQQLQNPYVINTNADWKRANRTIVDTSTAFHQKITTFHSSIRCLHTCQNLQRETPTNLKGKKHSSQQWLTRQLQDPYIEKAKMLNYRCRSAFKLLELNDRHHIFAPGMVVVDCGAAPGSWTQVAVNLTNASRKDENKPVGKVVAIDKLQVYPVEGADVAANMDFTTPEAQDKLRQLLDGRLVDLVLSDMAPNATGVREMDHENIIALAYAALRFALQVSKVNATFVVKVWDGGESPRLEADLRNFYGKVKVNRPAATRSESSEKFIIAKEFRGLKS